MVKLKKRKGRERTIIVGRGDELRQRMRGKKGEKKQSSGRA